MPSEGTAAPTRQLWRPTPLSALELTSIPTELHFVRDHFPVPAGDPASWSLELTGRSRSVALDLEALRTLPQRTLSVVLECAGHRRAEFEPIPPGVPWATGAVAEARWAGPSLATALELAAIPIPIDAREVVLEGADAGPVEGADGAHRFARSLPLAKALDPDVLLAHEMNGDAIPVERGGPVRAVVPGWYATDSVKWLARIWFTNKEFDGFFQAQDYRYHLPGEPGPGGRMTELPVNALITTPADGGRALAGNDVWLRGTAWGGSGGIAEVLVRVDHGPWSTTRLGPVRGPYARVSWEARCTLAAGPHEIACRALDRAGHAQPERPPRNTRGYANNAIHRINLLAA